MGKVPPSRARCCLAVIAVTTLIGAQAARADPKAPRNEAQPAEQRATATTAAELRARGNAEAQAGRVKEALPWWLGAWARHPGDRGLCVDIGRAYLQTDSYVEAATWLTRCVSLPASSATPEALRRRRNEVDDLDVARAQVAILKIETEHGAALSVDGDEIGESPAEEVFVAPKEVHRIVAHKGARRATAHIEAEAGKTYRIPLALLPAEPPPFEESQASLPAPPARPAPPPLRPRPPSDMVWWPIFLGATVAATGASSGIMLRIYADELAARAEELDRTVTIERLGCGSIDYLHDKCDELERVDAQRVAYTNASTAAFITSGIAAAAAIGFAAYEVDRVRLAPTLGGVVGSFQW